MQDEPVLGSEFEVPMAKGASDQTAAECIHALVSEEAFAVLCTQGEGQPYGSVVAFAFDHDLKAFVFATPRATRKFRLLSECDRVALVVDNRGKFPGYIIDDDPPGAAGLCHRRAAWRHAHPRGHHRPRAGHPCVNGVAHAVELLEEGQIVTVDGYLGIVTIGAPEFDLEAQ